MPFGWEKHSFYGSLTEAPKFGSSEKGSWCYFTIAINYRRRFDKERQSYVTPDPKFVKCSAYNHTANIIAACEKGDVLCFDATMRMKQNRVEKDGVITIYNDPEFTVSGNVEISRMKPSAKPDFAGDAQGEQQTTAPAANKQNPLNPAGGRPTVSEEEETDTVSELPF